MLSRVMIHQPASSFYDGQTTECMLEANELLKMRQTMTKIDAQRTGKPAWHKNVSDSVMNQWTNWLKVHYQYDLPESRWSRLVPQNWRNRINEHRVAQNKDLIEYDSEYDSYENEKTRLILYKKQQVDLLKFHKKIQKQYGYDLLAYKYLNYADKQKLDIYGYRSPFQAISIVIEFNSTRY